MVSRQKARTHELKAMGQPKHWWVVAVILGGAQALAMTYPFAGFMTAALQVGAFAVFIASLRQSPHPFHSAWLFATSWLAGSVAWLFIALHIYGHMPSWLSIVAIILLCGGLALYYSSMLWWYVITVPHISAWLGVLVLASAWTMAEMARAQWFTGFPWAAIGYAQVNSLMSHAAPYIGVYGIGFLAVCASAILSRVWTTTSKWRQVLGILVLAVFSMPASRQENKTQETISVRLLQANISQDVKYSSAKVEALTWYQDQVLQSPTDLTVLPETAIPYFKEDLPAAYWQPIERKYQGKEQALIVGIPTLNGSQGYGNSALVWGMTDGPTQYDKHHLVPFGEFTPDSLKWFNRLVDFGMTDFKRGVPDPQPFQWQQSHISVNICYEDLFGEELAKRFVRGQDQVPDILVNISNLGWFGNNYVVDQHLNIARMRSLEFNRPSVRATNSGGTAIINAQGEITHVLAPYTRGVLTGQVQAQSEGVTLFAQWAGRWGLQPLWLVCLLIQVIAAWQFIRSKGQNTETGQ